MLQRICSPFPRPAILAPDLADVNVVRPHASAPMPEVKLDAADAAKLAEMLRFLSQWLARDPARLGASLTHFVGHPAYGLAQLRGDLERFVFLLGGCGGGSLFGLPEQ